MILFCQKAFIYPGQPGLIAKWSPPQESSKFMFTQIAGSLGTVIAWPLLAMCMQAYGWAIAFYIPAGIGVITSLVWFFVVYNSPAEHPWISPNELQYIENSLQNSVTKEKVVILTIQQLQLFPHGHYIVFLFFLESISAVFADIEIASILGCFGSILWQYVGVFLFPNCSTNIS